MLHDATRAEAAGGAPSPLYLPVPSSVRAKDQEEKAKAAQRRAQVEAALSARGIDTALVPEAELRPYTEEADRPVTRAILAYVNLIQGWRDRGQGARADAH